MNKDNLSKMLLFPFRGVSLITMLFNMLLIMSPEKFRRQSLTWYLKKL